MAAKQLEPSRREIAICRILNNRFKGRPRARSSDERSVLADFHTLECLIQHSVEDLKSVRASIAVAVAIRSGNWIHVAGPFDKVSPFLVLIGLCAVAPKALREALVARAPLLDSVPDIVWATLYLGLMVFAWLRVTTMFSDAQRLYKLALLDRAIERIAQAKSAGASTVDYLQSEGGKQTHALHPMIA